MSSKDEVILTETQEETNSYNTTGQPKKLTILKKVRSKKSILMKLR
jgi:hypothetical protein